MSNWGNQNEKSKLAFYLEAIFAFLMLAVLVLVVVGAIGVNIYCFIVYGDTPVTELPSWVAWLMFRG